MNNILKKVIVDGREKNRIKPAKQFFENTEVYNLHCGDYAFIEGDKNILFEYKNIMDFISSIIDKRVFRQCFEMKKNSYKSYLIIHGDFSNVKSLIYTFKKKSGVNFNYNQFIGALARLYSQYNVILVTGDFEDVLYLMKKIAEKCFDSKSMRSTNEFKKTDNPALNYLTCIPGIGYKTAESIVNECGINSLIDLTYAIEYRDLTKIDGIGKVTAEKIRKNIIGEYVE